MTHEGPPARFRDRHPSVRRAITILNKLNPREIKRHKEAQEQSEIKQLYDTVLARLRGDDPERTKSLREDVIHVDYTGVNSQIFSMRIHTLVERDEALPEHPYQLCLLIIGDTSPFSGMYNLGKTAAGYSLTGTPVSARQRKELQAFLETPIPKGARRYSNRE